jgi:hypothetical protein
MASFAFPPLLLPPPAASPLQPEAVQAIAQAALLEAEAGAPTLPEARAQAAAVAPAAGQDTLDAAAMRPDQVMMARQMTWPAPDGATLAGSWRSMVRTYGDQLAGREDQARAGQLPGTLLQSGPDPRLLRQPDLATTAQDAWRFTIHTGGAQERHLRVVQDEVEQERQGRAGRRRARAALRLELVLADGTVVTVQVQPVAEGVTMELCAAGRQGVEKLRDLQPQLRAAVERAGLRVLAWRYRDTLPAGRAHARLPSVEAACALNLPVFRALAELALTLPG